jgi:glutathione S-transferase
VAFTPEVVTPNDPKAWADYKANINQLGKLPTLVLDNGHRIPESSIIIEYLENEHGGSGTKLLSDDKTVARQTRFFDRLFDLYLNDPMSTIFFDGRKPEGEREPKRVAAAKATLETSLGLFDKHFEKNTWTMGDSFSMADCAAAPALNYIRMVQPFDQLKNLTAYANRLAERPSFAKVMKEAQPYLAKMMGG